MEVLRVYTNHSIRSALLRTQFADKGIDYLEINVNTDPSAMDYLKAQGRDDLLDFPLPQFYVGHTIVWPEGWDEIFNLTAEQINEKVREINVSNK